MKPDSICRDNPDKENNDQESTESQMSHRILQTEQGLKILSRAVEQSPVTVVWEGIVLLPVNPPLQIIS